MRPIRSRSVAQDRRQRRRRTDLGAGGHGLPWQRPGGGRRMERRTKMDGGMVTEMECMLKCAIYIYRFI